FIYANPEHKGSQTFCLACRVALRLTQRGGFNVSVPWAVCCPPWPVRPGHRGGNGTVWQGDPARRWRARRFLPPIVVVQSSDESFVYAGCTRQWLRRFFAVAAG